MVKAQASISLPYININSPGFVPFRTYQPGVCSSGWPHLPCKAFGAQLVTPGPCPTLCPQGELRVTPGALYQHCSARPVTCPAPCQHRSRHGAADLSTGPQGGETGINGTVGFCFIGALQLPRACAWTQNGAQRFAGADPSFRDGVLGVLGNPVLPSGCPGSPHRLRPSTSPLPSPGPAEATELRSLGAKPCQKSFWTPSNSHRLAQPCRTLGKRHALVAQSTAMQQHG